MASEPTPDDIAYVTALTRAHDLPRYYSALFAPREARDALLSIYGFAAEIARVPNQVREPALGEIRLKWWSETLVEAVRQEGAADAPGLRAAAGAIIRHSLPLSAFEALIEARGADLYSDPPATLADLEGRMGETESALFQMAAIILGSTGPGNGGRRRSRWRRLWHRASAIFAGGRQGARTHDPAGRDAGSGGNFSGRMSLRRRRRPALDSRRRRACEGGAPPSRPGARASCRRACVGCSRPFLPLAVVAPLLEPDRAPRPCRRRARNAALSDLESLMRIGWARLRQ